MEPGFIYFIIVKAFWDVNATFYLFIHTAIDWDKIRGHHKN